MSTKDFQFLQKLGQGAYSSVYKVQRHADSEIYALKKVKMNNLSSKEQENALNQVRLLASIESPFIVGYKQSFIQNNSLCIIMEFSNDGDLYQKIVQQQKNQAHFKEEIIWKTLIQVAGGLKALHNRNILHRDLKSANVFLSKGDVAKLGDMNVSKIAKNGLLYTQTGTPYYASPEVWKDKPYDSKSDIWSLGCVIYEMATLKPPFRAEDMDGLYKKVIKGSYQKIGDEYSKSLASVLKSMLQVNPSNRPSADQLVKNLLPKAEEYGIDLDKESDFEPKKEMIGTIRAHKNLHYLTDRLPKSNYNNGHEYEKVQKMSQSSKTKTEKTTIISQTKNINLPKLDRIIGKNNGGYRNVNPSHDYHEKEKKNINVDMSKILKIEGKSNHPNPRYEYHYAEEPKKGLEKDIKAELRRIYNLKPSPQKYREEMKPIKRTVIKQLPSLPRIH